MSQQDAVDSSRPQPKEDVVDAVDDLYKKAKKYIPPWERKQLQEQAAAAAATPPPDRRFDSRGGFDRQDRGGSYGGYGDRRAESDRGYSYGRFDERGSDRGGYGGYGDRRHEDRGGYGGYGSDRGHGPSKWNDRAPVTPTYGADGLMPANPRLEAELFEKTNTGLNFEKYDNIPVDTEGDEVPPPLTNFDELDLGPVLTHNIQLSTFTNPTPVQKNAIPIIMAGRDLMACAQTGSGKTAAFLFPVIADLVKNDPSNKPAPGPDGFRKSLKIYPSALVLAPTRELAIQIHTEARKFTYRSHLRSVVVYGGAEFRTQLSELERGCHILVATPGRLLDMLSRGKVGISQIRYLCIDEADCMLDMGFEFQIRDIVAQCPGNGLRQTLMFSATFPKSIQSLAEDFLTNYVFLRVGRIGSTTDFITQRIRWMEENQKKDALIDLLPSIQGLTLGINLPEITYGRAVFCETKRMADHLEEFLYSQGMSAASIHGDRTQKERELALEYFKSGRVQILVATDVAARGLDVHAVKHVINFDLPNDIDDYVHRIGRTGRAGHEGFATAFFNEKNYNIARDLVDLMEECGQEVDPWLIDVANRYASRGTRPRRGGGGRRGGDRGGRGSYTPMVSSRGGGGGNYYSSSGTSGGNYGGKGGDWW